MGVMRSTDDWCKVVFTGCSIAAAIVPTSAHGSVGATITVENKTDSYVSVSIDGGGAFCSAAPHSTCGLAFPVGHHSLRAVRGDSKDEASTEFYLGPDGYKWIPFSEELQHQE